jgi:hypothetical protein
MNYIDYAKQEFLLARFEPIEKCENDLNKSIQKNIFELLEVFSKQGYSGSSAQIAIDYFKKLANFEPLTPITGKDEEWWEYGGVYQNKRLFSIFKNKDDNKPYFLNAIIWVSKENFTFTGTVFKKDGTRIGSRQYIKNFPFIKKSFYIDIKSVEVEKNKFEDYVEDESQLDEVFEYYDLMEVNNG